MRMHTTRVFAVTAAAAALLVSGTGTALADPPAGTYPATTSIVAVGAGSTDLLADQFSTDFNALASHGANFYSFDHFNPSTRELGDTIYTKDDTACGLSRPADNDWGIGTLQENLKSLDGNYCVDMSRSTRFVGSQDGVGIANLAYAKGEIAMATVAGGNGVANLTDADLRAIYSCDASSIDGASGPVTWKEVGGTSNDPIVPILPTVVIGDGAEYFDTAQVFLDDLGLLGPGSCVVQSSPVTGAFIDANSGANSVFTPEFADYKDDLVPYEAADYACQVYTQACPNTAGALALIDTDGKSPLNASHAINVSGLTAFPVLYIHLESMVIRNAGTATAPSVPTYLRTFLGNASTAGWICGATAAADIRRFGFATIPNCGALLGP